MRDVMDELAGFRADLGKAIRDFTDEIHSHRDALFQILDHIQPEEGPLRDQINFLRVAIVNNLRHDQADIIAPRVDRARAESRRKRRP